jgi:hypothetical protein
MILKMIIKRSTNIFIESISKEIKYKLFINKFFSVNFIILT